MYEQAEEQSAWRLISEPACLEADRELMNHLRARGYAGPDYERFEEYVVAASLPLLVVLIRNGAVFTKLRGFGRPRQPTLPARESLHRDRDVAVSLAGESVSRALRRCRRQGQEGEWGGWRPNGGASLLTWFVNASVLEFAGVFDRWQRGLAPAEITYDAADLDAHPAPEPTREIDADLELVLDQLSERERQVLLRFHRDGWSHRDIAPEIGTSEGGSAQLLRRTMTKMRSLLTARRTR